MANDTTIVIFLDKVAEAVSAVGTRSLSAISSIEGGDAALVGLATKYADQINQIETIFTDADPYEQTVRTRWTRQEAEGQALRQALNALIQTPEWSALKTAAQVVQVP